jgi:hypothetical protein
MKKMYLFLTLFFFTVQISTAQLSLEVYNIFQNKCMSCHSNVEQQGGLDLEGSGANIALKASNVYNKIVGKTPNTNAHAIAEGYQYIYKGRPDLSYLFRKINGTLESTIELDVSVEGDQMPLYQPQLTEVEKELIRQWILLGAPAQNSDAQLATTYVDQIPTLVNEYYNGNGVASFPNGAPAAPDPSEGFQVKMGPFYLNPAGQNFSEMELFQKYALDLSADVDVTRIDMQISSSSHHLIIYNFSTVSAANNIDPGFRLDPDHSEISLTTAIQEATDLVLPTGTAFIWDNDLVLDLNSHYINYDASNTYQAEVYFNVYTQPAGTALQEMKTDLLINSDIYIPNNGNQYDFDEPELGQGTRYVWGLMGHTHQWGTDYKMYLRNFDGSKGELIYDASCSLDGAPGCVAPFFDYQHIPIRYFDNLYALPMNPGLIHSASYENNGPNNVWFGPTSDDEMMVMVMMYTSDTTGLDLSTSLENIDDFKQVVQVFPNPMYDEATVVLAEGMTDVRFSLFNATGQEVRRMENISNNTFTFQKNNIPNGIYFFRVEDGRGKYATGKISIE